MSQESNKVKFMSIDEFKAQANVQSIKVLNNPHTNKDFLSLGNGKNMRCQNGIDGSKPMQFIIDADEEDVFNACLINYDDTKGATEKFSI